MHNLDKYSEHGQLDSRRFLPFTFKIDFTNKEYTLDEKRMLTAGLLNNKLKYLHMIDITNPRKFRGYSEIIFDNDLIKQLIKQKQKNDRSIT
jgi:hypothetical protein